MLQLVLLGLCCVASAMAGCAQDLAQDKNYQSCFIGYSTFLQQKMAHSSDIFGIICSAEGRQKMACVFQYAKQCPEVMAQGGGGGMDLSTFNQMGGLDSACAMMGGGAGGNTGGNTGGNSGDPCAAAMQCVSEAQPEATPDHDTQPSTTPFGNFPNMLAMICGPFTKKFACLEKYRAQCPRLVTMVEGTFKGMMGQSEGGPDMEKLMSFTKTECPKIPSNLDSNTCVKSKLDSSEFQDCYMKVGQQYKTEDQMKSCGAYEAGMKCIQTNVGQCGAAEANAIVKGAYAFIPGLPSNCKPPLSQGQNESGASSGIQASIVTLFVTMAMVVLF